RAGQRAGPRRAALDGALGGHRAARRAAGRPGASAGRGPRDGEAMMLAATVLAPALGALLALFARSRDAVLRIALASGGAALLVAAAVCARIAWQERPLVELGALLSLDGLAAPWVVTTAVLMLAVLAATPARK